MASGANSTFRQVGIATGIATLGSLFANQVGREVTDGLTGTPAADNADQIAAAITGGQVQRAVDAAPAGAQDRIAEVATSAFVDSLNHIILIAMVLAFATGILTLLLIRQKDFVVYGGPPAGGGGREGSGEGSGERPAEAATDGPVDESGEASAAAAEPVAAGATGAHVRTEEPGKHLP